MVPTPQDNAIQSMLDAKLAGKYSYIAANVVNHPTTAWVHAQMGATRVRCGAFSALPCCSDALNLCSNMESCCVHCLR